MSATGFHPEPSAKAPWTRTTVLTAAYAGDDAARAAPVRRARIKRFMVNLRQCSLQRQTRAASTRGAAGSRRAARHRDQRCPRLFGHGGPGGFDFLLHRLEVEARALLHWRELDRRQRQFLHLLLHEHEAPELVLEPV